MPLQVGQKLWFVPRDSRRGEPYEVTVEKIGRKWAQIGRRGQVDVVTMSVDGGNYLSPGQCYENRAAYEAERALQAAWCDFRKKVDRSWAPPDGATMDAIRAASAALFPTST